MTSLSVPHNDVVVLVRVVHDEEIIAFGKGHDTCVLYSILYYSYRTEKSFARLHCKQQDRKIGD